MRSEPAVEDDRDVEELLDAAVLLASDTSSFVNGQMLYVDGGTTASI